MKLTPRLSVIVELVDPGAKVIDVGTDHGYIPLYLIENRIAQRCIASDVNEGPLNAAKETLATFGVLDKVSLRLGNGLQVLSSSDDIDTVVIAGMGGETIISILENSLSLILNSKLILQPMTDVILVREFLVKRGFTIIDEKIAKEENRFYEILKAVKMGEKTEYTYKELRLGPVLLQKNNKLFVEYINKQVLKNERIILNLKNSNKTDGKISVFERDNALLKEVLGEIEGTRNSTDY
ncbi:SAM-dependent methyltransferase [Alkalicella caledoniensis]|uniref:SAM-dependent methyltransferase n=1 Tax=Alkalicella caledoniensis TaxID=2731377 RepID=A0A7G9WC21_ALKCA|nr:class I SAM-dependent methyltransferase [Alkalicella caledoniensis]QNO16233.1 SAM-dependent methyltransferase [Alkalicella caledoniensis]